MHYDDRLTTVLGLPAETPHARAVQWRQIVELLARGAATSDPDLRQAGLSRAAELMSDVPENVQAAASRAVAGPGLAPDLVALFAGASLEVAAPVISAAALDDDGWRQVRAAASPTALTMIDAFQTPVKSQPQPPAPPPLSVEVQAPSSRSAEARPEPAGRAAQAQVPDPALFHWECGPTGDIDWVEGGPRAALIGRNLADRLDNRFTAHLPFGDELLDLANEGPLAGEWRWSGMPIFFPESGRFAGYRGFARREGRGAATEAPVRPLDADSLRELVHELRTPLNAIVGFGEIIEGQFFGPAHQAYRDRAAEIVRQARRLADAVEDLDFAAKLQSGRAEPSARLAWDELFPPLRATLLARAAERGVLVTISMRAAREPCSVPDDIASRLVRRLGEAVIGSAAPGERIDLIVDRAGGHVSFAFDRPQVTFGLTEAQLLAPGFRSGPSIDIGFGLRLVRGLARIVGGDLDVTGSRLILLVPAQDR